MGISAGSLKEGRSYILLIDRSIQWFKNPPGKIVGQEAVRGKLSGLGNVLMYSDNSTAELLLLPDGSPSFTLEHKGPAVVSFFFSVYFLSVTIFLFYFLL